MHLIRPIWVHLLLLGARPTALCQLLNDHLKPCTLECSRRLVHADGVWSAYRDDDQGRPTSDLDEDAAPALDPEVKPGLDPLELVVNGETFVVSRRPGPAGTFDFDWISHPQSYGFALSSHPGWKPDRAELVTRIRDFLAEIDPETGYLAD